MGEERAKRGGMRALFQDRDTLRAVVDSVLEGRLGRATTDGEQPPRVARLEVGCYAILGGDAARPAARRLVSEIAAPRELVFPDAPAWRRLLHEVHPGLVDRSMQAFDAGALRVERISELAGAIAPGYRIRRLGADLAARLGPGLEPHAMQVFTNPETFAAEGVGFCAVRDGTIGCVASSYTVSSDAIELAIATHPDHRRLGLARAVAAALIGHCLERGIDPHWHASNPVSQHLAIRLGYRPAGICEVLFLA